MITSDGWVGLVVEFPSDGDVGEVVIVGTINEMI